MLGVRGNRNDCVILLNKVKNFLKEELKLNLSEEKTLITNARKDRALFLGTVIGIGEHQTFNHTFGYASRNAKTIRFEIPKQRIEKKLTEAGFIKKGISYPRFI